MNHQIHECQARLPLLRHVNTSRLAILYSEAEIVEGAGSIGTTIQTVTAILVPPNRRLKLWRNCNGQLPALGVQKDCNNDTEENFSHTGRAFTVTRTSFGVADKASIPISGTVRKSLLFQQA